MSCGTGSGTVRLGTSVPLSAFVLCTSIDRSLGGPTPRFSRYGTDVRAIRIDRALLLLLVASAVVVDAIMLLLVRPDLAQVAAAGGTRSRPAAT
jgi:hypothetical protein